MPISYDSLAVGVIVLVAAVWALRSIIRAVRAKRVCATCASSGDCPLVSGQGLVDLQDLEKPTTDSVSKGTDVPESKI